MVPQSQGQKGDVALIHVYAILSQDRPTTEDLLEARIFMGTLV